MPATAHTASLESVAAHVHGTGQGTKSHHNHTTAIETGFVVY